MKASELAAIVYGTFENVRGYVLGCQYPESYVSKKQFREIAHMMIPKAELTRQLITFEAFQHIVIGYPHRIEGSQYSRNALFFNVCFIIKPRNGLCVEDDVNGRHFILDKYISGLNPAVQLAYELMVRKINLHLAFLEEEFLALSKEVNYSHIPSHGEKGLSLFLKQIWINLRELGFSVSTLTCDFPPLYLIFRPQTLLTSVTDYFVPSEDEIITSNVKKHDINIEQEYTTAPLLCYEIKDDSVFVQIEPCSLDIDYSTKEFIWVSHDLMCNRILPLIDGRRSVIDLSRLSVVAVEIVRECLSQLTAIGVIRPVSTPMFEGSQSLEKISKSTDCIKILGYIGLPRLSTFLTDPNLIGACLNSVLILPKAEYIFNSEYNRYKIRSISYSIFRVYCKMCLSPTFSISHLISSTQSYIRLSHRGTMFKVINESFTTSEWINRPDLLSSPFSDPQDISKTTCIPVIDLLSLIQFGEVNNLIRRLYIYPISDEPVDLDEEQFEKNERQLTNLSWADGDKRAFKSGVLTHIHTHYPIKLSLFNLKDKSSVICHKDVLRFEQYMSNLELELWTTSRSNLMDGTNSVDSITVALLTYAMMKIQSACDPREWRVSKSMLSFNLPDAIVSFTQKLFKRKFKELLIFEEYLTNKGPLTSELFSLSQKRISYQPEILYESCAPGDIDFVFLRRRFNIISRIVDTLSYHRCKIEMMDDNDLQNFLDKFVSRLYLILH